MTDIIAYWRCLIGLLVLLAGSAAAQSNFIDADGRMLTFAAPPQRVVSLAPHLTELLYAAGAGDRLVGTVAYSDYPAAATRVPRVGDAARLDYERLLSLRPDLVLAWQTGTPLRVRQHLRALGLKVLTTEPGSLEAIPAQLREFGRLFATQAQADQAARAFEQRLAHLRRTYADRPPVRVFYQLALTPLMTVNHAHVIDAVIRGCGGRNVFADQDLLTPTVSLEAVLARQPQAVLYASFPGLDAAAVHVYWRRWSALPAVAQGNLFAIPADLIQRATPRVLDGMQVICEDLEQVRKQR